MYFVIIGVIIFVVLEVNKKIDTGKFIKDTAPYFSFLKEDDYEFLLEVKYGDQLDAKKLFNRRIRDAILVIVVIIVMFIPTTESSKIYIFIILSLILGYLVYKMPYTNLKKYYKANLSHIDQMLPYYLKGLEILIQHYTVPVALAKSIETSPDVFKAGLREMINQIESGDQSVDPYMAFAKRYPVRDSMRMMRLLYRLGLGSNENKQEQLMMFSRTVSSLQSKAREIKYRNRLDKMESKTMTMLAVTGMGILALLLLTMMQMMNL